MKMAKAEAKHGKSRGNQIQSTFTLLLDLHCNLLSLSYRS